MEVDTIKMEEMEVSMRPMLCKLNTQTRADGSVIFTQGKTKNIKSFPKNTFLFE